MKKKLDAFYKKFFYSPHYDLVCLIISEFYVLLFQTVNKNMRRELIKVRFFF